MYRTPSELRQGDACTSSGIVNGNFCLSKMTKLTLNKHNLFHAMIKYGQHVLCTTTAATFKLFTCDKHLSIAKATKQCSRKEREHYVVSYHDFLLL